MRLIARFVVLMVAVFGVSLAFAWAWDKSDKPHDDATFTMEPPGYHLHLWAPETGTITHTAFIGSFSGPHSFLLDPDYPAFGDKESAPATHAAKA